MRNKLIFLLSFLLLILLGGVFFGGEVFAQRQGYGELSPSDSSLELPSPFKDANLLAIIERIIGWLVGLAIPVAVLMVVIAGWYFMSGGVKPENITTAKNIMLYTVVGLAIIILAWGLVDIIQRLLGIK